MMKIIIELYHIFKFVFLSMKYRLLMLFQGESIKQFVKKSKAKSLVFTHILGGGTEQYVKNNFYGEGFLIVRKVAYLDKDLFCSVEDTTNKKNIFSRFDQIDSVFCKKYNSIIVNSLCQYSDIKKILKLCVNAKKNNSDIKILYMLHDFHCICPSINLYANGFYCYLQCEKHKCNYSVCEWRNSWQKFLENCDEIRCFSKSSKEILMAIYKTLNDEIITIVPHDMSYSKFTPITLDGKTSVFGVVGACKREIKGNKIMQTILKNFSENIRFVFIGTHKWELKTNHKNTVFLGKYEHDELQQILKRENVTHIIFPSVVPETFSYVVSEIMQMELHIICFNIGAQAEKVSKYKKGIVCENVEEMIKIINHYEK